MTWAVFLESTDMNMAKIKIAIARMILTAISHMFITGEVFNPSDLYKIDMPQEILEKQKEKAIKQAIKLLVSNGIIKNTSIL
jgi:transposase